MVKSLNSRFLCWQSRVRSAHAALPTAQPNNGCRHYLASGSRTLQTSYRELTENIPLKGKSRGKAATAYNERFCVIAAVTPQIMQCKLASYYPAASSVEAATTQSRHHVRRHQEKARRI